jgi:hypothetical protein
MEPLVRGSSRVLHEAAAGARSLISSERAGTQTQTGFAQAIALRLSRVREASASEGRPMRRRRLAGRSRLIARLDFDDPALLGCLRSRTSLSTVAAWTR